MFINTMIDDIDGQFLDVLSSFYFSLSLPTMTKIRRVPYLSLVYLPIKNLVYYLLNTKNKISPPTK